MNAALQAVSTLDLLHREATLANTLVANHLRERPIDYEVGERELRNIRIELQRRIDAERAASS